MAAVDGIAKMESKVEPALTHRRRHCCGGRCPGGHVNIGRSAVAHNGKGEALGLRSRRGVKACH